MLSTVTSRMPSLHRVEALMVGFYIYDLAGFLVSGRRLEMHDFSPLSGWLYRKLFCFSIHLWVVLKIENFLPR